MVHERRIGPFSLLKLTALVAGAHLASVAMAGAQGSAGTSGGREPRFLVDVPTAGMLSAGTYALDIDFFQNGGLLAGFSAGIFDRLSIGISYGGSGLIGSNDAVMNPVPGAFIRVRIIEEGVGLPAIALGFDSQGREGYVKSLDRYKVKSPGFYIVGSKNYSLAGYFSVHGGVNYSLERGDNDKDVNAFVGVEKTVGSMISLVLEYNRGINDDDGMAVARGRGYLNGGVRWSIGGGLTLGVDLKDLLENGGDISVGNRTVRLEYLASF